MGESAVLVHTYSFAAPITRHDSHEDNTIHALSQSISFGKFVTENLEWGKWSTFSHKKYVEEAEKYSRPGSVAQKKAFFEAHYKRIAEAKKAATQEQPTLTPAEVLLHTLETHPPLSLEEPPERKSIQNDDDLVVVVDDSLEEKENSNKENGLIDECDDKEKKKKQDEELLRDDCPVVEKEKTRRSITKNRPVFRLSLEKTIPPLSEKSERPMIQSSGKDEEKSIHRQKLSFLSCFMGNVKSRDQNQSRRKKKQFMCLSLKPKIVRES